MTKRFEELLRRGLALLLCLCMLAGYVPVPTFAQNVDPHHPVHTAECGYVEAVPGTPCTHEHGEACYTYSTACTHTHASDCCSDPESGVADICSHVCSESSGCVTKVLACTHVHDASCGYSVGVEGHPCTFVCTEDHDEQTQPEQPTEEPTEAPTEEATEPEKEGSTILSWSWVDSAQALDPDTGMLLLSTDAENPISFEQVVSVLPTAILAQIDGETLTVPIVAWYCDEYPAEGACEGTFTFVAELPGGYALDASAPLLTLTLLFDQPVTLEDPEAKIGGTVYSSLQDALDQVSNGDVIELLRDCELADIGGAGYPLSSGTFTIDLNGQILTGYLQLGGADLTIKGSTPGSAMHGKIRCIHPSGSLTINGGYYENTMDSQSFLTVDFVGTLSITAGEFVGGTGSKYALDVSSKQVDDNTQHLRRNITGGKFHGIYALDNEVSLIRPDGYRLEKEDGTPIELTALKSTKETLTVALCTTHSWGQGDATTKTCAYCGKANPYYGAVARVGDDPYFPLEYALDAARSTPGATVTLLQDAAIDNEDGAYSLSGYSLLNMTFTIDLNGYTLEELCKSGDLCQFRLSNTNLTITDSRGGGQVLSYFMIADPGTSVTINGGTFSSDSLGGLAPTSGCKSKLTITGGDLTGLWLRIAEGVTLSGGTFHGLTLSSGKFKDCLADGYCFKENGTPVDLSALGTQTDKTLTVGKCTTHSYETDTTQTTCAYCGSSVPVAEVDGTYYSNLTEALNAAASSGKPVALLRDAMPGGSVSPYYYKQPANSTLTINLNGHTLLDDENGAGCILPGQDATLTVNGTASGSRMEGEIFDQRRGGVTLTIQGGTYNIIMAKNAEQVHISGADVKDLRLADTCVTDPCTTGSHVIGSDVTLHRVTGTPSVMHFLPGGYCLQDENKNPVPLFSYEAGGSWVSLLNDDYTHTYTFTTCNHIFDAGFDGEQCRYCGMTDPNAAPEGMVAMVGQTYYGTVEEAVAVVAAAGSGTVKIVRNCRLQKSITINSNVTIDLNGKQVQTESGRSFQIEGGKVTITSSTGTGRIGSDRSNAVVLSGGTLTVDSGIILQGYDGNIFYAVNITDGNLILNQGVILIHGIKTTAGVDGIREYLASGTAFAKYDSSTAAAGSLVNGYTTKDYTDDLIVVEHTSHDCNDSGECPCGFVCDHKAGVDYSTGTCTKCGTVCYVAAIGPDSSDTWFTFKDKGYTNIPSTIEGLPRMYPDSSFTMRLFKTPAGTIGAFTVKAPLVIEGVSGSGFTGDGITVEAGVPLTLNLNDLTVEAPFNVSGEMTVNSGHVSGAVNLIGSAAFTMTGGEVDNLNAGAATVNISGGRVNALNVTGEATIEITDGHVGTLNVTSAATIRITGGQVDTIKLTAAPTLTISGGQIGYLDASSVKANNANVKLSGGTFDKLQIYSTNSGVRLDQWLETGYAFWRDGKRVERSSYNYLTTVSNVSVALCTKDNGSHVYSYSTCRYCDVSCSHPGIDAYHQCTVCYARIYVRITAGEGEAQEVTYYDTPEGAFAALDGITKSPVTMSFLGTYDLVGQTRELSRDITLDLTEGGFTKTSSSGGNYVLNVSGGNVTVIGGGQISCTDSAGTTGIKGNGVLVTGGSLNVTNGVFGDANGDDGTFGLVVERGSVRLTGGVFHGIEASDISGGMPTLLAPGYAFFTDENGTKKIVEDTWNGIPLYSSDLTLYVLPHEHKADADGVCECGRRIVASLSVNGVTTYHSSLAEAIEVANTKGGTVTLLAQDYTMTRPVAITGSMTLDLGGGQLLPNRTSASIVISSGDVTVRNGQLADSTAVPMTISVLGGVLTLDGDVTVYGSAIYVNGGTLTLNVGAVTTGGLMAAVDQPLLTCLPTGAAFAKQGTDPVELFDGSVNSTTENLVVVAHPAHDFTDGTGKCPCGYVCGHMTADGEPNVASYDGDGACQACGLTLAACLDTPNGDGTYKKSVYSTVREALLAASGEGCVVHVLSATYQNDLVDLDFSANPLTDPVTLDFHGHTLYATKNNVTGVELVLTDSSTTGGLRMTNNYSITGAAVTVTGSAKLTGVIKIEAKGVLNVQEGAVVGEVYPYASSKLTVTGGRIKRLQPVRAPEDGIVLSGGTFETIAFNYHKPQDMFDGAYYFYNEDGTLLQAGREDIVNNVTVKPHGENDHVYVNGECPCGYVCDHGGKNGDDVYTSVSLDTGVCTVCQKQVYEAYQVGSDVIPWETLKDAVRHAYSTVYLYCDNDLNLNSFDWGGDVKLDLNGHQLTTPFTVKTPRTLEVYDTSASGAGSLTVISVEPQGALHIKGGTVKSVDQYNQMVSVSGTVYLSDGILTHVKVEDGGSLTASGGVIFALVRDAKENSRVYLEFEGTYGTIEIWNATYDTALQALRDMVTPNFFFYTRIGHTLLSKADIKPLDGDVYAISDIIVDFHTSSDHIFGEDYTCICGYECEHGGKNAEGVYASVSLGTGVCSICGKQTYEAYWQDGNVHPVETLEEALREVYYPIHLYCDNDLDLNSVDWNGGHANLDLNGHNLTTPFAVQLAHTLEVQDTSTGDAGSLTLTSVESGGSLEINGGTVKSVNQHSHMISVSGDVHLKGGTLTFAKVESGGSLTASGGEMYALVKDVNEDSSVHLTGGHYDTIELWNATDDTVLQAFRYMVVPDNCFFYIPIDRTNDRLLSKADIKHEYNSEKNAEIFTIGTVIVKQHTDHVFDEDYTCICGYVCNHGGENEDGLYANLNKETGACTACGKQLYIVKVTTEDGTETFYDDIQKALNAAENYFDPTVLLLLADSDSTGALDYTPYYGNGITFDLGGHTLRAPSVKVTCLDFTLKNGTLCSSGDSGIALELSHVGENVILEDVDVIGVVKASEWGCLTVNSGSFAGWQGKDYAFDLEEDAFSNQVKLNGGTFHGLQTKTASLLTFLPEGKAFARADGSLFDASVKETTETLTVVDHPSHTFVDGKCECGVAYVVKLIADGTEKDYTDLLTAYKATSNYSSATLRLLRDVHIGNTFLGLERASTDLTLDLNGHTLTGSNRNGVLYNIHADVTITITGEGSVKNTSADSGQIASIRVMEGTVIIQGGTYDPCVSRCDGGVVKIYGGVFKDSGGKYGAVVSFTNNGSVSGMKELLAEGKTFSYDPEGTELVNVYQGADGEYGTQGTVSTEPGRTVYVVDHPRHQMTVDLNTCPCGFYCNHREDGDENGHFLVDPDTGVCPRCDSQVFEAAATSGELYATLEQALDDAKGKDGLVIKLLCDVKLEHAYVVEEDCPNFTLELNGYTVSAKGTVFSTRSTFTVKDSVGTGGICSSGANATAIYVQAGTLTITGGSIHADRANAIQVEGDNTETPDSKLVVGGGTFTGLSNAVVINGGTIELAGGVIGTPDSGFYGLYIGSNSTESIFRDGVVHGICYESFGGVQRPLMESLAENTAFAFGAPYSEENLLNANKTWETHETVSLGHHENHVFNGSDVCACGRMASVSVTAGQSVTYYATLKEAVAYASQVENSVVKLWDNVSDSSIVINDGTFTIDFNALMWSASSTTPILIVTGDADITLTGYSGSGDGIQNKSTGAAIRNSGKLTIKGGTYYSAVVQTAQGSMQISGGVFKSGIAAGAAPALSCETGHLIDLLAEGYALSYDQAGTQLMDAYTSTATDSTKNVYVVPHTEHTLTEANGYTCPCGYAIVASVATDAEITYFASIDDAVNDAVSKTGSTLTLLRDVTLAEGKQIYVENGNFTIDWHSHTLYASNESHALVVTYHAGLTLTDTVGGGGITNKYVSAYGVNLSGTAIGFFSDPSYTLTITGGTYSPTVKKMGYGTMQISGGVFQCPQGGSQNFALYNDKGDLSDFLAPGYGFYNVNSDGSPSLAKFYGVDHSDKNATVTVGEHKQHRLQDNGICVCDCGLRCWQKYLDENGHCDTCGYTFVAKVIVWTDYFSKTSSYFVEGKFNEAISHALNNPPAGTNDSSSVILLSDAVYSGKEAWNQNIDMDLNGHKLTLEKDAVVSGKVLILHGGQNSIIDGEGALNISQGLLNVEPNFSGTLNTVVLDSNGNLTVKEGSNPHIGCLELAAGARATLAGGTYEDIINATGDAITLGSLLYTDYAFRSIDGTENYKYNEAFPDLSDVKVVKCKHGEYIDGYCVYCNAKCGHKAPTDMTDPKCPDCGIPIVASVTFEGDVTYFTSVSAALTQVASCTSESGSAATLALLRSADLTETVTVHGEVPITLDLNGHSLTAQNDAQIILEDVGADYPLVTFTDSNPGENQSNVTVAVDHVSGWNARSVSVVSGHWGTFNVKGHLTMSGGEVDVIDLDAKGAAIQPTAQISAGTVRWLGFDGKSKVTLTGGCYGRIYAAVQSTAFNYTTLLGDGNYAFAFTNVSGENRRPPYAIMKAGVGGVSNVEVVECGTDKNPHAYRDTSGNPSEACLYCDYHCPHTTLDDTLTCKVCGCGMEASVTQGSDTRYFWHYCDAHTYAGSADNADAGEATLTLLRDVECTCVDRYAHISNDVTLNLNGHSVTGSEAGYDVDPGVTLTLTDSVTDGTLQATFSPLIRVIGLEGKVANVVVKSGNWNKIEVWDMAAVTMTDGRVHTLDIYDENAKASTISGGTVDLLYANEFNPKLSGGEFTIIACNSDATVNVAGLLAKGYAFARQSGQMERIEYSTLPTLEGFMEYKDVQVTLCEHGYYKSGFCVYCNHECEHPGVDENGNCDECGMTIVASLNDGTTAQYFADVYTAFTKANELTEAGGATITILRDAQLTQTVQYTGSTPLTFDLNGTKLTPAAGVGIDVSQNGTTVTLTGKASYAEKSEVPIIITEGATLRVNRGIWGAINVKNGTLEMMPTGEDGEHTLVDFVTATEADAKVRISGGNVRYKLLVSADSDVILTGGFFGFNATTDDGIKLIPAVDFDFTTLLGTDEEAGKYYAFANKDGAKKFYSEMKGDFLARTKVVECNHINDTKGESGFVNGVCQYCDYHCPHTDIDSDGKCGNCEMQFEATVTQGDTVEYYATLAEAVAAAHRATDSTVKLLADNVLTEAITSTATMTLDLNGKKLTKQNSAGEFFVEGGTLTLVDTGEGGTAETIRFTFRNESRATLQSGKWGELHCFGLSRFSMEAGEAASIIANCDFFEVRGGKVGYLNVQNKYVTLVGGFFGRIASSLTLAEGEKPIPSFQLLGGGLVFQKDDGRVRYADLPDLPGGELTNVSVVECTSHDFAGTNYCIYCHLYCEHEVLDKDTGYCADCANQIYEARIGDGYYPTLEAALAAAAAMGGNPTVTMLCNCGLDATYEVTGAYTLDLNGHELTSEGYTFPLHVKSGTLTIQDSKGTGKVSSEFGNGVKTDKGAMLIVEGGTFGQHRSNGFNGLGLSLAAGSARLRGGTFQGISSGSKMADIVDSGYWYFDENGQLYKVGEINGTNVTLTVKPHTHTYVDGECACGTLAQASVTTTDGAVTYYTTFRQALDAAVANNGCTLTLLDSPKFGGDYEQTSGNFTLDLNGKELEDKSPFWTIRSPASVKFVGDGTVWPTLKLTHVNDETTGTAFYGGTYYSVLEVRGSTFVKRLGEANHFAFRNDADGTWLNPTSTNVWWYYNLTATAVPYVAVQPANASVSYGADQLPTELTNLTASFESDWTVSAVWYYKNAADQWVAITASKSLTSGTAYGTQQFDNTGFIVGQYTLRCDLTATKDDFPTYEFSSNEITLTVEKAEPVVSAPTASSGLVYTGEKQDLISTDGTTTGGKLLYSTGENGSYSETIPTGTDAGTYEIWYKVEGDSNYKDSAPEKLGNVTIFKASADKVEITLENELVYDGTEQTQDVKITLNGKDVTDQFEITGNTRTDAGKSWLTVTAKGDSSFTGSKQKEFTVAKKDIGDETAALVITLGDELTYNRRQQTKQVTEVKINDLVVPYYTVSGNVGTDAGSYTLTVTASSGNFTGSATAGWEIKPWDITHSAVFMVTQVEWVYNGEVQTNGMKVYLDNVDITAFCDMEGQTFKNAGSYTVTATGTGNYTGKISTEYTVNKATVDVPTLASKPYTGENQTADVPASDLYTVTKNNGGIAVGDYDVELTLTDPDNYQWKDSTGLDDSVKISFSITHVENGWDTEPTITGWTYGDTPNAPEYAAKFGTVKVEYSADGITYTTVVPTNAGSYKVRLTVDATDDFDALEKVLDVTIAKREVTITNTAVDTSKVYDGNTSARVAFVGILNNMVSNDDVKIKQGTAAYADKNVGTAKTVTFTGFTLEGSAADNYTLTDQPADTLADITARDISLTVTVKDKSFDGTTDAEIDSATLNGVVPGDDVTLTGGKPTLAGAAPGQQDVTFEDFALEGDDAGNYNLTNPSPDGVTATIESNSSFLDLTDESDFDDQTDVSIDGDRYPIQEDGSTRYVTLPDSYSLLTIYTYVEGTSAGSHTNYPTSMRVYRIITTGGVSSVELIPEFNDLLQYNGCSIRVTGNQGIRMLTAITKSNKAALTGSGLAGYTLEEYGTVVCWASGLPAGEFLTLSKGCARSNYAYKKGVADPIFAQTGSTMQYTNVLVGFSLDQCSQDMIMRPYITLRDAEGNLVTLYGGSVQRSIGYIATQNRSVFPAGSAADEYVWEIIHAVYGDAYDDEYQG